MHPESLDAGSRELDRERYSVQLSANVDGNRGISVAQRKFAQICRCALDEQLNRREAERLGGGEPS